MKVEIYGIDGFPQQKTIATLWLDAGGQVCCDKPSILEPWRLSGIVGRASRGRLFPQDGQAFLEEMPHAFRGAHFMAVVVTGADP